MPAASANHATKSYFTEQREKTAEGGQARSERNMQVPPFCLPPNVCLATSAIVPIPSPTASPAVETDTSDFKVTFTFQLQEGSAKKKKKVNQIVSIYSKV